MKQLRLILFIAHSGNIVYNEIKIGVQYIPEELNIVFVVLAR